MVLFELLNGIDVDTNISTSSLVKMIGYFKNTIIFTEDEIPNDDIIDKFLTIQIFIKILGKIIKHAFVDGGAGLNIYSSDFLKKFSDKLMSKFI